MPPRAFCVIVLMEAALIPAMATFAGADPQLNDAASCESYVRQALDQYTRIRAIEGCYKGDNGRWHPNHDRHYNWCMTATPAALAAETRARTAGIERCMSGKGDSSSID